MTDKITQYRENKAINYSLLSSLKQDPRLAKLSIDGIEKKATKGMIEGSVLDTLCFENSTFFNKFDVIKDNISEKLLPIAQACIDAESVNPDFIVQECKRAKYQPKWSIDALKTNVIPKIEPYIKAVLAAKDKTIIDEVTYTTYRYATEILQTHPFTAKYFTEKNIDGIEVKFQVPVYWTERIVAKDLTFDKAIDFKGLIDIQVIDHNTKCILNIDLKKNAKGNGENSFYYWGYYLQASMYYVGTLYNAPQGYTVLNPVYIYSNAEDFSRPRLYKIGDETLKVGKIGGWDKSTSEYKKGYYDLVQELYWHITNNRWEYSREEYENDGLKITDNFTTINPFNK